MKNRNRPSRLRFYLHSRLIAKQTAKTSFRGLKTKLVFNLKTLCLRGVQRHSKIPETTEGAAIGGGFPPKSVKVAQGGLSQAEAVI